MDIFQHTQSPVPPDCTFKISPSSIGTFFDYPSSWYKQHVLGEAGFEGSTASVIGTSVHYCAEQYALGSSPTREFMEDQIDNIDNDMVNKEEVKAVFPGLAKLLINEHIRKRIPTKVEHSVCAEVLPGIYAAGTIDALHINNGIYSIEDYKTASTKPSDTMPFGYKIQQLTYAWILKQQGHTVDKISLIYVVKPTKTLPERLFVVSHIIKDEDFVMVEDTLKLIAESVQIVKDYPELTHLIFKSYALKEDV